MPKHPVQRVNPTDARGSFAQRKPAGVVCAVRGSLIHAQELKQNSLQFVDSIVAQDIGKLPDNSVADALQRIPGIQVGRSNGEVSTVVIRGLPNLGTTLNGHEIFTGNNRGVALQDIPAELIAGVDVYKTSTPEQTEGGIAGLIDIRLRRPLDFKKAEIAGGARAIRGENAKKTGYVGSVLLSDRWKMENGGEFGALVSSSYQRQHFLDSISFNFLFSPFNTPDGTIVIPDTQGAQTVPGDRRRIAHSVSLQWRPTSELEFYTDVFYTEYRNKHQVHFLIGLPKVNGVFDSATLYPGTNVASDMVTTGNLHLTSTQAFDDRTDGYQAVAGTKWHRDNVKLGTEIVYNWNSVKTRAVIVDTQWAPVAPATFHYNFNKNGMADLRITGGDITDQNDFYLWGLFDNHDYATSDQISWKADAEYALKGFIKSVKAGVRLANRDVKFRQTTVNNIAPPGGRGVYGIDNPDANPDASVSLASIAGMGSVSPDGNFSDYGTPNWVGANPDFLYNNTGTIRQLFGLPTRDPDFDPAKAFTDKEKTYAAYVQATYGATVGGMPLDGLVGVRVAKTKQSLTGYFPNGSPLSSDADQTDVLPVLTGRLRMTDKLLLRGSIGRTVTRPDFSQLNPATSLVDPTTTGGAFGTGNGGNPELTTVRSDNFDLSLEYYFARESYVSATGFVRRIDGYVQNFAAQETSGPFTYIVGRPRNSGKGELKGLELSYQHFPAFLPDFLKGFGWQTNFTYIDGDTDAANPDPALVGSRIRQPYPQVAETSYNVIGIYERGGFSARLAYNYRGEFTDTFNGPNNVAPDPLASLRQIIVKPTKTLDFSASYRFSHQLTLTFDVTNITDSVYHDYFYDQSRYPRDTRAYDRTYALGLRFHY
jgi:TonB-dependent receptor